MIAFSDALYLAFPFKQINCTPDVFKGVGIFTSIFWPKSAGLKLLFSTTFTSILVRPTSRTKGITRKGSEMSFVVRYLNNKQEGRNEVIGTQCINEEEESSEDNN